MQFDDMMGKVGQAANKGVDLAGKAHEGFAGMQSSLTGADIGDHTMYETFSGGIVPFAITDNSIVYGKMEFPFDQLQPISITVPPSKIRIGAAQTKAGGILLVLQYTLGQAERFAAAVSYANEHISAVQGAMPDYRYALQAPSGNRIEAYEAYLLVYAVSDGIFADALRGGQIGDVLEYSDISAVVKFDKNTGAPQFIIMDKDGKDTIFSTDFLREDVDAAREIVKLIEESADLRDAYQVVLDQWVPYGGAARKFTLNNEILEVSADKDAFNEYYKRFVSYADRCIDAAEKEYASKVRNLETYLRFFPRIYNEHLDGLIGRAIDALILSGVYTVTASAFRQRHLEEFDSVPKFLEGIMESVTAASVANMEAVASVTSYIPNLVGGGFGFKNALKGVMKAEAFNFVRDTVENKLIESASQIKPDQARELYARIEPAVLLAAAYSDYRGVCLTMVKYMQEHGLIGSTYIDEDSATVSCIFENLSNPVFPQDKMTSVFLSILNVFPYAEEYHQFMVDRFGDTGETRQIREYFGFA